jgi:hypothetical protein
VKILFVFSLKTKRLQRKAGTLTAKIAPIIRSKKIIDMLSGKGLRNTGMYSCVIYPRYAW